MKQSLFLVSLVALSVGACSSDTDDGDSSNRLVATEATSERPNDASNVMAPPAAVTLPAGNAESASPLASGSTVIGLEGLGALGIGQPLPASGEWTERGAQTNSACRIVSSPEYPGVYAIVTDDKVSRITVGKRSDVKLAEGIGVGASEEDVEKWFAGFRAEPHKYESAPAKYLTAPNARSGDPALRFEIGSDGRVSFIHIGVMPVLAYVEGCA